MVAGYFDPDYGDIRPREKAVEIIELMLKEHDKVPGGVVMVPMVKFNLFDRDLEADISEVRDSVSRVGGHLEKWSGLLADLGCRFNSVRISHTDQDMLTISFPVPFTQPAPLIKEDLIRALGPTLDLLQKRGLL